MCCWLLSCLYMLMFLLIWVSLTNLKWFTNIFVFFIYLYTASDLPILNHIPTDVLMTILVLLFILLLIPLLLTHWLTFYLLFLLLLHLLAFQFHIFHIFILRDLLFLFGLEPGEALWGRQLFHFIFLVIMGKGGNLWRLLTGFLYQRLPFHWRTPLDLGL